MNSSKKSRAPQQDKATFEFNRLRMFESPLLPVERKVIKRPRIGAKEMKEGEVSSGLQAPKTAQGRNPFHLVGTDEPKDHETKQQPCAMSRKD